MRFKSKHKQSLLDLAREWVWPKAGWRRWTMYFWRRVWRLADSPHTVAIGFSAGACASFTPFLGLHFIIAFAAAYFARGSMIAAAVGTTVGNPLTFPFIWFATFNVGNRILGGESKTTAIDLSQMVDRVWHEIYYGIAGVVGVSPPVDAGGDAGITNAWLEVVWPIIKPMTVGSVILGPVIGLVLFFPIRAGVGAYQRRRRERLVRKHLVPAPTGVDEATS